MCLSGRILPVRPTRNAATTRVITLTTTFEAKLGPCWAGMGSNGRSALLYGYVLKGSHAPLNVLAF